MKKLILMTMIATATMAAAPATSNQAADAPGQPVATIAQPINDGGVTIATAPAVEEKKVCKLLPESGTRLAKRACLTAKQWTQLQAQLDSNDY